MLNGTYFDDEIFNIRVIAGLNILQIIRHMNSIDVHPPGSYVINKLLLDAFGSWFWVKIAGGIFCAFGLAVFQYQAFDALDTRKRLVLAGLLATSASVVMWGIQSLVRLLRPDFRNDVGVLIFSNASSLARTVVLAISAVLFFHISYLAFVPVPVQVLVRSG